MAFTIVTADNIGTTTRYSLAAGDDLLIVKDVTVGTSDSSTAVLVTGESVGIAVEGTLVSQDYTIRSTQAFTAVSIGKTGSVISLNSDSGDSNIYISGYKASLSNAGQITSLETIAVFLDGNLATAHNSGSIVGSTGVVLGFNGTFGGSLVNTGSIVAGGPIDGVVSIFEGCGVFVGASSATVLNEAGGQISSTALDGAGIVADQALGANGLAITNHGTISASQGMGITLANMGSDSSASIKNFGTISGEITAIADSDAGNTFVNGGLIVGNVLMNGGDDVFRSVGNGQVVGTIDGGAGADKLVGGALEDDLLGGEGNDDLRGRAGDDTLDGGLNDDMLNGGTGDDDLRGGNGEDTLKGGAGDDIVGGGNGRDVLTGGSGADVFLFVSTGHSGTGSLRDVVTDFEDGADLLDFSGISGVLTFRGLSGFSASGAGELRLSETGSGNTVVVVDANGDGVTDMQVLVNGVTGLGAEDFVL